MGDETYTAQIPVINSASIIPNPSFINTSAIIQVFCEDKTVVLYPSYFQSGEIQCGEV